jgi:hypothetical protein
LAARAVRLADSSRLAFLFEVDLVDPDLGGRLRLPGRDELLPLDAFVGGHEKLGLDGGGPGIPVGAGGQLRDQLPEGYDRVAELVGKGIEVLQGGIGGFRRLPRRHGLLQLRETQG